MPTKRVEPDSEPSTTASITETTQSFWVDRIKGALLGVLIGALFVAIAIVLLAWNEGRAIHTARSLAEGARLVVSVPAEQVSAEHEGKLVHLVGAVHVFGEVRDPEFGLRIPGVVKLRRDVEMYQWSEDQRSETQSKLGGGQENVTTYSYAQRWSSAEIDSNRFRDPSGHHNPTFRIRAYQESANSAAIGAFGLSSHVLQKLNNFQTLPPELRPQRPGAQWIDGGLYLGDSPDAPKIGDMRVTWAVVPAAEVSVIGQQRSQEVAPFPTEAGDYLLLVADGRVAPTAMIDQATEENAIIAWLLRLLGTALIYGGAVLLLRPLVVLADIVPLLGMVMGLGIGLIALLFALVLAPVTIALAWLWFRPLLALGVLLAASLAIFGLLQLKHRSCRKIG